MKKVIFSLSIVGLFLSGCATKQEIVAVPELITPPHYLLADCTQTPATNVKTNIDLVKALQASRTDFDLCNSKMKALRNWYSEMEIKINQKE